jgi:hypothetical protein
MAFTLVTIFFVSNSLQDILSRTQLTSTYQLTLGFFATFFGMNNEEMNEAHWMHLDEQIKCMCRFRSPLFR